jgi:phage gp46-like protein
MSGSFGVGAGGVGAFAIGIAAGQTFSGQPGPAGSLPLPGGPADIALVWNPQLGEADMQMASGDLLVEAGLQTAVIISLFTDAPAQPGDVIPDGSTDVRGWWGDMPVDPVRQDITARVDRLGSRLWLLDRALQAPETLVRAEAYAREALAWMLDDGVAGSIVAAASFPRLSWIQLVITIAQQGSRSKFTLPWQNS